MDFSHHRLSLRCLFDSVWVCVSFTTTGVLLSGLVHGVDVQRGRGLGSTLQHPSSRWKEGAGQADAPEEQRGLRGVQSQSQGAVCPPLQPPPGKPALQ